MGRLTTARTATPSSKRCTSDAGLLRAAGVEFTDEAETAGPGVRTQEASGEKEMTRAAVLAGSLLLGTLPAWSQFSLRESNEDLFLKRPCAQQWPPSEVACPKEHAEFVRRL